MVRDDAEGNQTWWLPAGCAFFNLATRTPDETMAERGVQIHHATMPRCAMWILPLLGKMFRWRRITAGRTRRVGDTCVRVARKWKYLYRSVDRLDQTVDFTLTAQHAEVETRRIFERAVKVRHMSEKVTFDKHGTNTAVVRCLVAVICFQSRSTSTILKPVVEQDHWAITRRVRPMSKLGLLHIVAMVLASSKTMYATKKERFACRNSFVVKDADLFYSLLRH